MSTTTLATKSELNYLEKEVRTSLSASSSSTLCSTLDDQSPFHPDKTLLIQARGVGCFRLPLPNRQLEIDILHPDGHLAYTSTRDRVCSGNSVLSNAKLGDLIRTEYFFGPNRDPVVHLLQSSAGNTNTNTEEIHLRGQWTSRSVSFTTPSGSELRWSYAKEKRPDGRKVNLIVLGVVENSTDEKKASQIPERRLAQLLRCEETRTPQTSRSSAGNGGTLQMDEEGLREYGVDEALVVATCLTMLKKEVDRRRMIQMMVIAGAAGGGS
ncbi:uncharacterized protein N7473_001524 [Penicillium subrubescens]|uniref:Uncharacterized protein n=1 Tax=Penicillium subrubescens TaxID=1316194 RepID=A0A1Q5UMU9_9EURO|nr:uncharacterized protein N7473_001524 [Penicillium subrubescens]KAJ5912221.1 hypothetical protein N7473_001524 [Penicillium subrubescens]OKP13774.1 hypothetical protein PENSUB_505 [Penicillium subrubescens]